MADIGDLMPLSIEVRDETGALTNASTVLLTITLPDGTTALPAVTNPPVVTGQYVATYVPVQVGRYMIHWSTVGPQAAFSDTFDARDLASRSIISLAGAKSHLNMSPLITKDDEEIRNMVEAVTSVVERYRGEAVVRRTVTEQNVMGNGNRLILMRRPVIAVTEILNYQGIPQNVAQWTLDKDNGTLTNYLNRWNNGRDMTVTYEAGYSEIPSNYILAAKIILAHLWSTQRIQNIGQQVSLGTRAKPEEAIITPAGMGYAIPMRAVELLGGRPSVVV